MSFNKDARIFLSKFQIAFYWFDKMNAININIFNKKPKIVYIKKVLEMNHKANIIQ